MRLYGPPFVSQSLLTAQSSQIAQGDILCKEEEEKQHFFWLGKRERGGYSGIFLLGDLCTRGKRDKVSKRVDSFAWTMNL